MQQQFHQQHELDRRPRAPDAVRGRPAQAAAEPAGPVSADSGWCDTVKEKFGDLTGKTVGVYTTHHRHRGRRLQEGLPARSPSAPAPPSPYEDSKDFEAQVLVRIQSGNPPDVAIFPQPGLLSQIVNDTGAVKPLSEELEAFAKQYFPDDWMNYGVVNDIPFGLPNNADFKSLVWYNPQVLGGEGLGRSRPPGKS